MSTSGIHPAAVAGWYAEQQQHFLATHPRSVALAERAKQSLYGGVPMHWMSDWSTPVSLFVERAEGVHFYDVDGHRYLDFCLGDTGSMFGHSPAPIAQALREQATRGLTTMLPGEDAIVCGELLSQHFGLPFWQVATTATDANRFVLRWVRAITGRNQILVFDGCYHGTVDDTLVRAKDGRTQPRSGLLGQVQDLTQHSVAVPFNDLAALEAALKQRTVAAVLCEPAMTNIGMVLPEPGFHQALRELTRRYGTLLIIDETHTLSTGLGGCTRAWNLEPDFITLGKPIAGGVPCSVYGASAAMAEAMHKAQTRMRQESEGHSHSGMGTTLSANALAMHCMRANLEQVMTEHAYRHMLAMAAYLAEGYRALIDQHQLKWSVTELGARSEFQFCPTPPHNGAAAEAAFDDPLQQAIHLYLINHGILITPFHNMTLCSPYTEKTHIEQLLSTLDQGLKALLGRPNARL